MHEGPPNAFEKGPEPIPTQEEVRSVFEQLAGGEKYETVRELTDEKGLYLWDIIISVEDGSTEYSYMRAGRYREGQASETAIHVTFFDKTGTPVGGHSVAKYEKGEWELTP
ncbi:hypothetical protein A3D62_03050 [Candidatus Kaiserbacteria bacterium RIFCSPHIGHO2_02_FULL_49_11]|uniref:Uncharacterized protein n=1 Tax=Candidatus Kaiserbacteria bacterium RIFCSPHIGHO2_02_FULL_49_11 TaxID=1798489 RepID=A0A1F6D0V1_9BACT|nr:MAG: hypothetical protein A3D62_03050 [Candidatus Kaiserbacteria bacterium RIFCSPHIGHO2_02_FULL_49_11]